MRTVRSTLADQAADAEWQRVRRYNRLREWLLLLDLLTGWALDATWLTSGLSARLAAGSRRLSGGRPWLADALYAAGTALARAAANLPMAYLRDYVVEHRYGVSTQTHRQWAVDHVKASALGLAFEAPLTSVSYAVIRRAPRRWWLILSGASVPFTVVLAQLYPVLIAPIFNRFTPSRDPMLAERIQRLATQAGVRIADVVEMDLSRQTRKANAFFSGIGPTRRIALGDTLVREFTHDEIEVIVAHELGHQVHRDIWKGLAFSAGFTFVGAWALSWVGPAVVRRFGPAYRAGRFDDVAAAPLVRLVVGIGSVLAMPLGAAFSRHLVERPADAYALDLTGRPRAFISAMERLARLNLVDPDPPRLVHWLLHSHPSIRERTRHARQWQRRGAQAG